MPVDRRPDRATPVSARAETGFWCGPVSFHYGHMIADFGMRIAASSLVDARTPLIFSVRPGPHAAPRPFFWEIIHHFGVARERVHLVAEPTRFERLRVMPQAERLAGGGPGRAHLDRMDRLLGPMPEPDHERVYVTRVARPDGQIAGEAALTEMLARAGVTIFDPESVSLADQIALYRRARHLIFAEGSAVHSLQLIGRLNARVSVLARRPRTRLAAASLAPRVRALDYVQSVRGTIHGLRPTGVPQVSAGISVLDERRLLPGLARLGVDLSRHWDSQRFAQGCAADVAAWVERRRSDFRHAREEAHIGRCLRALAIEL